MHHINLFTLYFHALVLIPRKERSVVSRSLCTSVAALQGKIVERVRSDARGLRL